MMAMPSRRVLTLAAALAGVLILATGARAQEKAKTGSDPATRLWYAHPADKWENAFPVGNGRLGAMVFGKTDDEEIQLNEETYWSGGPYSTVVKGGYRALPEIRKLVFEGNYKMAHILFGRNLMGYPVEQMKYQSLGRLVLRFPSKEAVTDYRHELDLDAAVVRTEYSQGGVRFTREVFVEPRGPGRRRPAHGRPAGPDLVQGPAPGRAERGPLQLRDRLFPHGRPPARRPRRPRQVGGLHGRDGRAPLREPAQGPARGRNDEPGVGRAQRDRRRRRDPARRRGHELRQL